MQHPILTPIAGGASIDEDAQERKAWGVIASACEEALSEMHPHHPQRQEFVEMWAECRRAAGLPCEPGLRLTA